MQELNAQALEEQIKQMKQMQQAMQQQMQSMNLNLNNLSDPTTIANTDANTPHSNPTPTDTSQQPLVSQLLQLNNNAFLQNAMHQQASPILHTPTMPSTYTFPAPNPMLPTVLTPHAHSTTPKQPSNPFDSALVANGLSLTMQQIVAAQNAQASTPKGASHSPLNNFNIPNSKHPFGGTASLDLTSHSGSLGQLAALRSSSADSIGKYISNEHEILLKNAPNTPKLPNVPSLPALQPTASVGSLLSFRGLSDPLTNLASGLPRMDSSGLFLPTVHRENSIPQVPTTPNLNRNLSELSMMSGQGNSHFVPYNATGGYFEPPTPGQRDGTHTPTLNTPNMATAAINNVNAATAANNPLTLTPNNPYAQFTFMTNATQNRVANQNKMKPINNNVISANANPFLPSNATVSQSMNMTAAKIMDATANSDKKNENANVTKRPKQSDKDGDGNEKHKNVTLMAEGKITVTTQSDLNNPKGLIKNPKGLTLELNTEQAPDDIDEQVIITPNLMNLNSLTGGQGSLSPQLNGFNNQMNVNHANQMRGQGMMNMNGMSNNAPYGGMNPMMMNPMMMNPQNPNGMMSPGWGQQPNYGHMTHTNQYQTNTMGQYNPMTNAMNVNGMNNQWGMNNMNVNGMNQNMSQSNNSMPNNGMSNSGNRYGNNRGQNNRGQNNNNNNGFFPQNIQQSNNQQSSNNGMNNGMNNRNSYGNNRSYNSGSVSSSGSSSGNRSGYGGNNRGYNSQNTGYNSTQQSASGQYGGTSTNTMSDSGMSKNIPPRQQRQPYGNMGGNNNKRNPYNSNNSMDSMSTSQGGGGGSGTGGENPSITDIANMDPRQLTRSNISLSQLIEAGVIEKLARDQNGSRFIQQRLETASLQDKEGVFRQIQRNALALCEDVFGNYVIQKFFEHGTDTHRIELAQIIRGRVLPLTKSMYGCRVIQKAFEYVHDHLKITLVSELKDHVEDCVRDQNGNHVIQKVIAEVPSMHIMFIINTFKGKVYHFSTHPYGCRVIQRLLEHSGDGQKAPLLDELIGSILALSKDSYGNYVVQHVLKHGPDIARNRIIREVATNVLAMSKHKFSSNVVEKCFMFGNDDERDHLLECVIGTTQENSPMVQMVRDQYGNYVIQKLLEVTNVAQRNRLIKNVMELVPNLRKLMFGKHIIAKIEKITGKTVQ